MIDGQLPAPRLKIAGAAMAVENDRRRYAGLMRFSYRLQQRIKPRNVLVGLHKLAAVSCPINQHARGYPNVADLCERDRAEANKHAVDKVSFIPGRKPHRNRTLGMRGASITCAIVSRCLPAKAIYGRCAIDTMNSGKGGSGHIPKIRQNREAISVLAGRF